MYKIKVQNPCNCFFKSGLSEALEFDTKEEAKKEAESMIKIMKSNFCQKHVFDLNEQFGDFTIFIKPRS
ncbi:MAG: hypothetical protein NTW78_07945 [Campylobacterales bacterium]|nr:hypothetical protein [Campylobacterales bacterium]